MLFDWINGMYVLFCFILFCFESLYSMLKIFGVVGTFGFGRHVLSYAMFVSSKSESDEHLQTLTYIGTNYNIRPNINVEIMATHSLEKLGTCNLCSFDRNMNRSQDV